MDYLCIYSIQEVIILSSCVSLSITFAYDISHLRVEHKNLINLLIGESIYKGSYEVVNFTNKLKTFTVAFDGAYNEAPLAKLVAERYKTHHTEINISFDNLKNDVENILTNYGEPFFDSSAIPSYYVSKEAKKHLTVIINGDGADELFGGYRRYVPFAKYDFFKNLIDKRSKRRGE